MKILIDESLDIRLKGHLNEFDVYTARDMGWLGIKNGKLLSLTEENNFEIFLTADKNLRFQQNLSNFKFKIVVLRSFSNEIDPHILLIPKIKELLTHIFESDEKVFEVL